MDEQKSHPDRDATRAPGRAIPLPPLAISAPSMPARSPSQLNVTLSPEQREWLETVAESLSDQNGAKESLAGAVRWVIDRARTEKIESELVKRTTRKTKFLENVRLVFDEALAAEKAEADPDELATWMADKKFVARVQFAQMAYLGQVQEDLRKIGTGSTKGGNALALLSILNSYNSQFGRVKAENIQRAIGPMLKDLLGGLISEFGNEYEDRVQKVFQMFAADAVELKLTDFT